MLALLNKRFSGSFTVYGIFSLILALYPFLNDSRSAMILVTKIFIFGIFAISYDLLLGYTGIWYLLGMPCFLVLGPTPSES